MRQWIDLFEMRNAVTQRYIQIVYNRLPLGDVTVSLKDTDIHGFADLPNMVELAYIEVEEGSQGRGLASEALIILTQTADDLGVTLVVTVATATEDEEAAWPMTSDDLAAWYERYGFVGDRKMIREPQPT